jgi:FMN phosphatase YigB (HAD superfamily)
MKTTIEIYGFSGRLGAGKNYVSENIFAPLLTPKKTIFVALANHFKVDAINKEGLEFNKVYGKKDEHTRITLQRLGTEEGRDKYGENIWVNLLDTWITLFEQQGFERVIIQDVRFPNELDYINSKGGTSFRIVANQRTTDQYQREAEANGTSADAIATHRSETSLDGLEDRFNHIINNDYNDNPFNQVRDIVSSINLGRQPDRVFFVDLDDTISLCNSYYMKTIDNAVKYACTVANVKLGKNVGEVYKEFQVQHKKIHTNHYYRPFNKYNFPQELIEVTRTVLPELDYAREDSAVIKTIYDIGMSVYDVNPEPIEGGIDGIRELQKYGQVVICTLGDRLEQMKKVAYLGLADLDVEVVHHKVTEMYHYMKYKYPAKEYFMVGDNFVRDVQPALEAGFEHVYHIAKNIPSEVVTTKSVGADNLEYKEVGDLKTAIEDHISGHVRNQELSRLMYQLG